MAAALIEAAAMKIPLEDVGSVVSVVLIVKSFLFATRSIRAGSSTLCSLEVAR